MLLYVAFDRIYLEIRLTLYTEAAEQIWDGVQKILRGHKVNREFLGDLG